MQRTHHDRLFFLFVFQSYQNYPSVLGFSFAKSEKASSFNLVAAFRTSQQCFDKMLPVRL